VNYKNFFLHYRGSLGEGWANAQTIRIFFQMHMVFFPKRENRTDVMVEDVDSGRQAVLCSIPFNVVWVYEERELTAKDFFHGLAKNYR